MYASLTTAATVYVLPGTRASKLVCKLRPRPRGLGSYTTSSPALNGHCAIDIKTLPNTAVGVHRSALLARSHQLLAKHPHYAND